MVEHNQKVTAARNALRDLGAKVRYRRRKLRHRRKTYLHVVADGGHHVWQTIVMPAIHKHFPDAYLTSGSFCTTNRGGLRTEMNITIALEK